MIDYERGLYVRIQELPKGPHPLPLQHGFSQATAYRVLGIYNPSESGECWLVLSNDRDELWYIAQRHVRTWKLLPDDLQLRLPLEGRPLPAREADAGAWFATMDH
jgi:hypothetical protein